MTKDKNLLRILIICPNFNRTNMRKQPWRYAFELSRHLFKYVSEIRIMTNRNGASQRDFVVDDIYVHVLKQSNLRYPTENMITTILNACADVIYWFGNSVSGLYLKQFRQLGIPFVLHISAAPFSIKELLRLRYRKLWDCRIDLLSALVPMNWIVRLLNCEPLKAIVVPSKAIGLRLISLGIHPNKVKFAPLSFCDWNVPSRTIPEARDLLGLHKEKFMMTYFGGSDTIRGTDIIIRASLSVRNDGETDLLTVMLLRRETKVADEDELYLQRLVERYNLADKIQMVSKILSRDELALYLFASDLIVLPFKIVPGEPPLGVLEALSLEKPVVTTDVSGLSELVTPDRGVLIRPANADDLAKTVRLLIRSPETRVKLGRNGKNFTSKLGGFEDLAKWTLCQLSEVVSS